MSLHRYWFEFGYTISDPHPPGTLLGCGVTAYSYPDALQVLRERIFAPDPLPPVQRYIENVEIPSLDPSHVLPNMGDPTRRGVWFPLGYDGLQ